MRRIVVIIFTLLVANSYGQTFDWWAQVVHWDGVSEWPKYMITQPAYMGPNALPVPRIGNGSIDSSFSMSATGSLHFSKGDNTQNFTLYANYCLVKDVISFDASWIPYEHFTMSHAIKEQRHVFSHFYYDQQATGDIELNTTIQLLNRWRKNIQLALRIGYRFPTGTGLGVARYTDGPGYHFDLSFGKPVNTSLKCIGMLGFYSWQLINVGRRQDDAFLFGTGAEWNTKTVRLQTYISGYLGYQLNSGDKPVVFRATVEKKIKRTSLLMGFQQGLHDFGYSSLEMGVKFRFQ
jgi:hypothetical protein